MMNFFALPWFLILFFFSNSPDGKLLPGAKASQEFLSQTMTNCPVFCCANLSRTAIPENIDSFSMATEIIAKGIRANADVISDQPPACVTGIIENILKHYPQFVFWAIPDLHNNLGGITFRLVIQFRVPFTPEQRKSLSDKAQELQLQSSFSGDYVLVISNSTIEPNGNSLGNLLPDNSLLNATILEPKDLLAFIPEYVKQHFGQFTDMIQNIKSFTLIRRDDKIIVTTTKMSSPETMQKLAEHTQEFLSYIQEDFADFPMLSKVHDTLQMKTTDNTIIFSMPEKYIMPVNNCYQRHFIRK